MLLLLVIIMLSGCAAKFHTAPAASMLPPPASESLDQNRMLIRRVWLTVEVASVTNAASEVSDIARQTGGYVESQSVSKDEQANLTLRIPSNQLEPAMATLESIGKVTSRRMSSEDVTEQYVDTDARLKTKIALRDRLRGLLDRAENVNDVLAIERELSRVQADIDSMQARLKSFKGMVDLASVNVTIQRKRILGPLGYIFKGTWTIVEKLFVIQG